MPFSGDNMLSLHLEITLGVITATVGGLLLAGKAARASSSVGGVLAERDVALGVTADHERWGVDHLLGHTTERGNFWKNQDIALTA